MNIFPSNYSRRTFLKASSAAAGGLALGGFTLPALAKAGGKSSKTNTITLADLPKGTAPKPVSFPHFPSRLHAFVWRNWPLVTPERMASVVGAKPADISRMGRAMGLGDPPRITRDQQARSYITVIKRNWHLLPYEQLLELLDWSPEQLAFTLREDDFLWVKLGNLKPRQWRHLTEGEVNELKGEKVIKSENRSDRPRDKRLHPTDRPKRVPPTRTINRNRGERPPTKEKTDRGYEDRPRTKRR